MKTELTTEQSLHLIELGVPKEKASELQEWEDDLSKWTHRGDPIFTLTDLLEILPKEIKIENKEYRLITEFSSQYTFAFYYRGNTPSLGRQLNEEFIDALYELTVWCIKNKHLKLW